MNNEGCVYFRSSRNIWVYEVPQDLQIYTNSKTISSKTQRELKLKIDSINHQKIYNNTTKTRYNYN